MHGIYKELIRVHMIRVFIKFHCFLCCFVYFNVNQQPGSNIVMYGIDLKEFYPSVEWDILEIPAGRNEEYYPEYSEPFSGSEL